LQLADAFDSALTFIKPAIEARSGRAAYRHGSFGSGKSHFRGLAGVLLAGVRSVPGCSPVSRCSPVSDRFFAARRHGEAAVRRDP
jgi:hypothetical protein